MKFKRHNFTRSQIFPILQTLVIVLGIKTSLADHYVVPTGSMEPTILPGDHILVNKLAYNMRAPLVGPIFPGIPYLQNSDPKRGDVVVFDDPRNPHLIGGQRLVKRLIGIPGDTVEVTDGRVKINGRVIEVRPEGFDAKFYTEYLGDSEHLIQRSGVGANPFPPLVTVVPQNAYFFMGDNRDRSADSREWGFAHRDNIIGRAELVISPHLQRMFTRI
jgi:signal peptidase I